MLLTERPKSFQLFTGNRIFWEFLIGKRHEKGVMHAGICAVNTSFEMGFHLKEKSHIFCYLMWALE